MRLYHAAPLVRALAITHEGFDDTLDGATAREVVGSTTRGVLFTAAADHRAQLVVVVGVDDPARLDEFAVTRESAGGVPCVVGYVVPACAANRWARAIAATRGESAT